MNRDEELFQKRLKDLANMADRRNIVMFTDFLNLNELNIYHSTAREFAFLNCKLYGGYENAERQIIAFIPDALSYEYQFPISCIKITPIQAKFADKLSHRDYLGAILNLGIDRSVTGDIVTFEDGAWLFCLENMADFICSELSRVKHTPVNTVRVSPEEIRITPEFEHIRGSVASVRLDSILALAFGSSRSSLVGLIEGGKVFVNGRLVTSNGYKLKEQDIISARGLGRCRFLGISSSTRKGRLIAEAEKYI